MGQKRRNICISIRLGQKIRRIFYPGRDDVAGLVGLQGFPQDGMEDAAYGATVFGQQLLRQTGFASDGTEIPVSPIVFDKPPESQAIADEVF